MPTQSALTLVEAAVAQGAVHAGQRQPGFALPAQAAFARALIDEVERLHPENRDLAALREQLGEELTQLAQLVKGAGGALPAEVGFVDVLVVDDDDDARRAAVQALESLGYPCRTARDAEEALGEYDRRPAAIVFSDWCMPGMSGLELCAALKRRVPPPYVILATAFHDNARLLDCVRGGADDFLRKPIDLDELEARLFAGVRLIRAIGALHGRLRPAT
jgi:CheY-like chemotaxis protein